MEYGETDSKKSNFNEAFLKIERIHFFQSVIGEMWINPLKFQQDEMKYGYEIIISQLFNLLTEVWGKLTDKEKIVGKKMKFELLDFLEENKIYTSRSSQSMEGSKSKLYFNKKNWKELRMIIFDFEMWIQEMLEAHEYGSPNKIADEDAGWD